MTPDEAKSAASFLAHLIGYNDSSRQGFVVRTDDESGNIALANIISELQSILSETASIDSKLLNDFANFGSAGNAKRVAALLGNVSGIADFGSGTQSAQTLRTTLATNSPGVSDLAKLVQLALNYGTATGALRVAAQVGNASGVADFGPGSTTAQTIRTLIASDNYVNVIGGMARTLVSFTRPNNATPYTARDVIGTDPAAVLQFTDAARANGGSGYITKAHISTTDTGKTNRVRLHIFNQSPAAILDNSPFTGLYAHSNIYMGFIDTGGFSDNGGSGTTKAISFNADCRLAYVCDAADNKLYVVIETLDAYTPLAQAEYTVSLTFDRN